MRDVYPTMLDWAGSGRRFALARVVETWGSAPRRPGAAMLVSEDGAVAGSVSGGCIEGAVITEARDCLESGERRVLEFGVDAETAWSVGLSCGGRITVLVQPFNPASGVGASWMEALGEGRPLEIRTPLGAGQERIREPDRDSKTGPEGEVFVHVVPRQARLLIVGGADIATHLTAMASRLDFEITVLDPRAVFTDPARFDVAPASLLTAWPQEVLDDFAPDEETCIVLLTHDPKVDDPVLHAVRHRPVRYVGALGGRKTQRERADRLRAAGFSDEEIARIRGPVGLDIGARDPSEIAVSILAELVAVRNGDSS